MYSTYPTRLKEDSVDPGTIAILVQTLGPIVIPLIAGAVTWLGKWLAGRMSPATQAHLKPFLPIVSAAIGTALGAAAGGGSPSGITTGAVGGLVGGLAATGAHQAVTQLNKSVVVPKAGGKP